MTAGRSSFDERCSVLRFFIIGSLGLALLALGVTATLAGARWWLPAAVCAILLGVGIFDVVQRKHSLLRIYPVVGHLRYLLESVRPELQQYFVERNFDGRPFDRDVRTVIYERAKGFTVNFRSVPNVISARWATNISSTPPRLFPNRKSYHEWYSADRNAPSRTRCRYSTSRR